MPVCIAAANFQLPLAIRFIQQGKEREDSAVACVSASRGGAGTDQNILRKRLKGVSVSLYGENFTFSVLLVKTSFVEL